MTCLSEVVQVPDLVQVPFGTDGPRVSLQFRRRAWVVGVTCSVVEGDLLSARASMGVAIQDAGQRAITLDGISHVTGFAMMSLLCPGTGLGIGEATFPLVLPVEPDDVWTFQVHNYHASINYTPRIGLLLAPNPAGSPRPRPLCSELDPVSRIVLATFAQLNAGETSPWVSVQYPEKGRVTGLRASSISTVSPRSNVAIEVFDPECREAMTTDGRTSVPISAALLAPGFEQTMPLDVERDANKRHRFRAQNTHTAAATPLLGMLWDGPFLWK